MKLLKLREIGKVPVHLRFNRFVHTGYRAWYTTKECLQSMLVWHNETVNIWTHFVSLLLFLAVTTYLCVADIPFPHNLFRLLATVPACVTFALSVAYHTFLCHDHCCRSRKVYRCLLCADVAGVVILGALAWAGPLYYSYSIHAGVALAGEATATASAAAAAYVTLSVLAMLGVFFARSPAQRIAILGAQALFRIALIVSRLVHDDPSPDAVTCYVLMELCFAFGGVANAARVPERFFPGRLDTFANSHQIMHVVTAAGVGLLYRGMQFDSAYAISREIWT